MTLDELTGSLNHLTLIFKKEAVYNGDEIQEAFEKASKILTGYIDDPKIVKNLKIYNKDAPKKTDTIHGTTMDLSIMDSKIMNMAQK